MFSKEKLGFIGGGAMAEALIRGITASGLMSAAQISVSDVSAERLAYLNTAYGVSTAVDNVSLAKESTIIILAVKPFAVSTILEEIAQDIKTSTMVISIAAGVLIETIEEHIAQNPVVRVMPNTPVAVGEGMSVLALGSEATAAHGALAEKLLGAAGKAIIMGEEYMDAVSGLSGSGPGYAFVLIDALADAGVRVGLPRKTAIMLAAQTMMGAAKMVLETGEHPAVLRDGVTSPGGTTIAGIHELEKGGVRAAISEAVYMSAKRSREMGQKN